MPTTQLSPLAQSRREKLLALSARLRETSTELQADLDGEFGETETAYADTEWIIALAIFSDIQARINANFTAVYTA